jgi:hypothetical protein
MAVWQGMGPPLGDIRDKSGIAGAGTGGLAADRIGDLSAGAAIPPNIIREGMNAPTPVGDVPNVLDVNGIGADQSRVTLRPFVASQREVLGPDEKTNILAPLYTTNGMLFPYTPTIQFSQDVDYKNIALTHTNYDYPSYTRTPSVSLSVSGKFAVTTQAEGRYLLAALHFLRVVSKMYFGKQHADTSMAGMPPPVLLFKGYGPYMFEDLRVVVKNHSYTLDDTTDLLSITAGDGQRVRLPAVLMLSMTLQVVQTPRAMKDEFNLDKFRTGALMSEGTGGWI